MTTLAKFGARTRLIYETIDFAPYGAREPGDPTPQLDILLCTNPNILVSGGEQAGKSYITAKKFMKELPADVARARQTGYTFPLIYWLVADDYAGTEREFTYIQDDLEALGGSDLLPKRTTKLDPGIIKVAGGPGGKDLAWIRTKSARDFKSLRMEAPSGIMGCEASQIDLISYERMKTRVAPRRGWLFLSGTMEGGWFPRLHRDWQFGVGGQSFSMPTHLNAAYYPGGWDDPAIIAQREHNTDDFFSERFMGIPCPPKGLVLDKFRPDFHVADIERDPAHPVYLWEDPGYGSESAHAILVVQVIDGQVRIFDEIYTRKLTTEQIIDNIIPKRGHLWKLDQVTQFLSDPHYAVQHHSTGSVEEIWLKKTGLRMLNRDAREKVAPRVERVKSFLLTDTITGGPKILVSPRCKGWLSECGVGSNPFDDQEHPYQYKVARDGMVEGMEPIDKWNHSTEALGRGLVFNFGHVTVDKKKRPRIRSFRN